MMWNATHNLHTSIFAWIITEHNNLLQCSDKETAIPGDWSKGITSYNV